MESRLRMLIVLAGYPEPIVNVIIGHENGEWRIRLDLSYPHLKLVLEYDGWHHRLDRRQWSSDLKRREWLEGRGWRVIVVNSEAFYGEPVETLLRIRGAMLSRGERRLPLRPPAAWVRQFVKPVGPKLNTGGSYRPEFSGLRERTRHWWSFLPAREPVPGRGVEPLCPCGQTGLSRPRIPFRHPGRGPNQCATAVAEHGYSVAVTAEDPQPRTGAKTRVVVAEDEVLIRLDLAEMLTEEGYEVVGQAGDGQAAVDLAKELQPDLVVMDVKMPKLDGISAAEKIASARIAPVVMLTAFSQRDLVDRATQAGAMAYVVKPFGKADLIPAIEVARARFAEIQAVEAEVSDLNERLESRKAVDRAKGLLQAGLGLSEPEAFRWIQKTAMDLRKSMREVADGVIEHGSGVKKK